MWITVGGGEVPDRPHSTVALIWPALPGFLRSILAVLLVLLPASRGYALEQFDAELSLYVLGAFPRDNDVVLNGVSQVGTIVSGGVGAGFKAGFYPKVLGGYVGLEYDLYGHGGEITFALATGGGSTHQASTDLTVINSMVNLLVRYPRAAFTLYGGVGIGHSSGILSGTDIPGRQDQGVESAWAFGYQFLGGLQAHVSERVFVFAEYKYFAANYHWNELSLDYRANYVLSGLGVKF